jgi:hypothetical protein
MDGNNNLYVGGVSNATWGTPVQAYSANGDAFAVRLESATGNLIWNTFIGGNGNEQGQDLRVDGNGNIFSVGTGTATFGTPVRAYTGGGDAFVASVPPPCVRSANSGLWSSNSSWEGGVIPTSPEGACILDKHVISLDTSPQIEQLLVEQGGTLEMPLGFNLAVENFVYSEGTMTQTQVVNNANVAFLDISNAADTAVKYRGADVSSSDDLGEVTVSVRELAEDDHCTTDGSASPAYARRCYEITAENDLPATVRLWSLLTDLNDIPVTKGAELLVRE